MFDFIDQLAIPFGSSKHIYTFAVTGMNKTINNSFATMGISKEKIKNVLEKLGIDSKLRAENLTMEQFADISNNM